MRSRRAVGLFVTAFLLSMGGLAAPSVAQESTLQLSWSAKVSLQVFTATLTCSPNASTQDYHDAYRACSDIAQAGGDFKALPGQPGMNCVGYVRWNVPGLEEFRATATGIWNGQPVSYDIVYKNHCEFRKATGQVFVW